MNFKVMKIFKTVISGFSILAFSTMLNAQIDNTYERSGLGSNVVGVDGGAEAFETAYKSSENKTKGFRVQLIAESGQGSQDRAQAVKNAYLNKFKNSHKAYLLWDPPNFKVRVGDFSTKFEAAVFWKTIQGQFPNSYVVEDEIYLINKKSN